MKKSVRSLIAVLVLLVATFAAAVTTRADGLQYTGSANGNQVVIADGAGLFQESDKDSLVASMEPVAEYCNVLLLTTNSNSTSQEKYAWQQGSQIFGQNASFTVFLIDMDNRQIYIGSTKDIRQRLTTARANTITDNTYRYASNGDYASCARTAFEQMTTILAGGRIPAPMKMIGCALIALIAGLTICYIIMSTAGKMRTASVHEIEEGMGREQIDVSNVRKRQISTHIIVSGGGGSGGGGSSGGGGGGGGFGGGGHGF